MPYERVKEAIEDIKQGKMVVMVDDEDRENEGDLVFAATFSTPEKINFMITHAKGLVCVCINEENAKRLNLTHMVQANDSAHNTAFTVTVDAREARTGISAYERDMTIKILNDHTSSSRDLVRPGHIFPLIAKKGGVLVRTGHTEGSVDLCRLAGLNEVAVICEIVKENGEMARRDDLEIFCKKYNIKMVSIADIVKFRMKNESLIREIGYAPAIFLGAKARRVDFLDHFENHQIAYIFRKIEAKTAVKFHNVSSDFELLSSDKKYFSLINSIEYLKKEGGVLMFISYKQKTPEQIKDFGIGAQILRKLGVKEIKLLTSKKGKEFIGIKGFGLDIIEEVEI